jgi:hypothetical protein
MSHGSKKVRPFVIALTILVIDLTTKNTFGFVPDENIFPDTFADNIFDPDIHTVRLCPKAAELSLPVIELNSGQQLELGFDDLSGKTRNFEYTFLHCSSNWKRSALMPQEYLEGFGKGNIQESFPSFNTTYHYRHYRLLLPETECRPVISGNYALIVYDADNPDHVIFIRRLYVKEEKVVIYGKVKQPPPGRSQDTGQQVWFTVFTGQLDIRDPYQDIIPVILQNRRDDNALTGLKPAYVKPGGVLEYTDPEAGIFQGGNEYRDLNIKSMKYQTANIAAIDFMNPYYHVILKNDQSRAFDPYFNKTDLNGNYFIDQEKAADKNTEADYVYVHFTLENPNDIREHEDIYVFGALSDWKTKPMNKLSYNSENNSYELVMLLKQGYYDYSYAVVDQNTKKPDDTRLEGSHFETTNEYGIFIYYHDPYLDYDRLAGYQPIR